MVEILVQTATGISTTGNTAVTFSNSTVNGNSIIVIAGNTSTSSANITGITDTQGNFYVKDFTVANALMGDLEVWHASGIIGGTSPTLTIAYSSGLPAAVIAREYYGTVYSNMLDRTATATGSSTTLASGNTGQTAQSYELLIGTGLMTLGNTYTVGAPFVNLVTVNAPLTISVAAEDLMIAQSGIQSASFGTNVSSQWACGVATFFLLPTGTTTSTSFTTSTSISSTSISSTSSSISSTSISTSLSSTSTSLSSTSSSISTTTILITSTSISSTSSSTSISSTSISISSTSISSTSMSSTSTSISFSSTSSSYSSTSTSHSSTSVSISSTSLSSTSSSSSTSTTTLPPPYYDYTYQEEPLQNLQINNVDLINKFNSVNYGNVSIDDGDYFIERGSQVMVREYKSQHNNNIDNITMTWKGRSTISSILSPIYIQIFNQNTQIWETMAKQTLVPADTDFQVIVIQNTNVSNYYDVNNIVTFRSYQQVV